MNKHISYHTSAITHNQRSQLNGHQSVVLWFTGLPCSGKSTLAYRVEEILHHKGCHTFVLDGDNVRHGLSSDLDFSDQDRKENIRRVAEITKLMAEAGMITIAAFISPLIQDREKVRQLIPRDKFIEIYCQASLATCEDRDVKGLYRLARAGKIKHYTGVDAIYEPPTAPELIIDTKQHSIDDSALMVLDLLKRQHIIDEN